MIYGSSPATMKYHDCRAWAGLDRGVETGGHVGSENMNIIHDYDMVGMY